MADTVSPAQRSVNMSKIRAKDTKPEMIVRRLLHRAGYRYRLHRHDLPGKPDIVFGSRRKAIFVHGCFWHQHSDTACLDGRRPKSNPDYWNIKLARNIERDERNRAALMGQGWDILVIWECEVRDPNLLDRLTAFLD
ncbi:very short patch repair endonuclease [Leptolyngbya sp. 7M]|uniref:very short patch repair endonuclease n=1 Tax=Leptolyngbya sp. 7M TaxID=2812896 RepID=UPI001B8B0D5E|nr:DNA mismatch endonuclease Vsr [Leptolyngbya sp. 7M]QYO62776.1 DNA mismatch endonuclease Vsr [Leptolyngbya sp. 7M]